ncbi:hypothetical protein [Blastococcus brunescens]|uniref:Uncharacterized protein n=1 Tax=Blastococcus brunescens TaxID=1564165 RepID=A0ABZ1AZU0_9ACTN|nr:hypothetical protein [Blastococcus sp. BMG 8361]WRL64078.1 hypothetical protein U6N30_31610 [Blastococcus sp. BMG 8361]
MLELCAVAGREVSLDLLEAARTPAEEALGALDSAVAVGLVVEGRARGAGGSRTRWSRRCWSAISRHCAAPACTRAWARRWSGGSP